MYILRIYLIPKCSKYPRLWEYSNRAKYTISALIDLVFEHMASKESAMEAVEGGSEAWESELNTPGPTFWFCHLLGM